jgi:uncharacterized protein YxeA
MKFIKPIIIALALLVAVSFGAAFFFFHVPQIGRESSWFWGVILGVIAAGISLFKSNVIGEASSKLASDTIGAVKDVKETIESNIDSKQAEFFAIAEKEYEAGEIDKGLWSQALVKAKGDDNLRKVEYMKLRAKQLKISNKYG